MVQENLLCLNAQKSCVIPVAKDKFLASDIPTLFIGGNQLKLVDKAKNLGFVINSRLACDDHVNEVVSKIFFTLRCLRATSPYVPVATKKKLITSLIVPYITYFEIVYGKLDSHSLHKLNIAINSATRYVFGLKKYDHLSSMRNSILGCDLQNFLNA